MKTIFTFTLITIIASLLLAVPATGNAQSSNSNSNRNIVSNSSFDSGHDNWNTNGMNVEINGENSYGGSNSSNKVAEIDVQVGLRQQIAITAGQSYQFSYKASRRTTGGTQSKVGITLTVTGNVTGTKYVNFNKYYTNTSYSLTPQTNLFTIPANSTDKKVTIEIVSFNNSSTLGVIVDDVTLQTVPPAILPVEWVSFTAALKNEKAVLNWETANEKNNNYFIVERSSNGNSFDSVGIVAANSRSIYQFTDATLTAGVSYYRLRQVDIDGKIQFSKTVIVRWDKTTTAFKVFPTIATSTIQTSFTSTTAAAAKINIYDANGRLIVSMQKAVSAGANQQSVNVTSLPAGLYYFQVQSNDAAINHTQAFRKG
jgi:hypothetical protein